MKIIKRNGEEKPFQAEKIAKAISKANESVIDYERLSESQVRGGKHPDAKSRLP